MAAALAGLDRLTTATDAACEYCTARAQPPRGVNKVTCDLGMAALRQLGRHADAEAIRAVNPGIYPPPPDQSERLAAVESGTGVGSHLWRLLSSLAIRHNPRCDCLGLAEQMNRLGPAGCRRERPRLVAAMRQNAQSYGWTTVATAAATAVGNAVTAVLDGRRPWLPDPLDPYGSCLDEAVRRAESDVSNLQSPISNLKSPISNRRSDHRSPITDHPIDILIPVGRGSKHDDLELRFALRSIQHHARGVRRVWIVGRIPAWLHETDQVRLVRRDEAPGNKAYRIAAKVEWACRELDLTKTFAFWNDDYLLTQDLDVRTIPPWHHGDLSRGEDSEGWQRLLGQTGEALRAVGLPSKHYDIHVPILLERSKYLDLSDWWQRSREVPMTMKSVYGNHYCDAAAVPYADAKLADQWQTRIDQLAASRPVISYGNAALSAGFADWMAARFPDPHPAEATIVAVLGQFRGGTSAVAGVLHALGVDMGSGWPPSRRTNRHGTFEDRALARLCRRAFREPGVVERMPPPRRVRRLRRWAARRTAGVSPRVIGAKHPTLCLCIPQLLAAWPAVRFVAVDRPASESVASIARAMTAWSADQAEAATRRLIETRDQDLAAAGRTVLRVAYHDLLADPAREVDRLIEYLGLIVTPETRAAAIATVDPLLRTVS